MSLDEMIQVLQDAKAGKAIQQKAKGDSKARWHAYNGPYWCDFFYYDYRVKPELRQGTIKLTGVLDEISN